VNFLSMASPLIGPDRLGSTIEDVGGSTLKFGAYQFFKGASQTMVRTPFGSMSGFVSETIEAVAKDAVFPAAAAATVIQILVHAPDLVRLVRFLRTFLQRNQNGESI
jgi:hypothetical protein